MALSRKHNVVSLYVCVTLTEMEKTMGYVDAAGVAGGAGGASTASVVSERPSQQTAAVITKGLSKRFAKKEVLRSLSLELPHGQITGLLGPSGCGKTTLVNQIVGLSRPSSGSVVVLGEKPGSSRLRPTLGFMPQSEALYQDLSATENLFFFGALYGIGAKPLGRRAQSLLEALMLADTGHTQVSRFSGGMKRRLSLAIALLHEPKLLVLDEPTVGLDPVLRLELWEEFRRLAGAGTTILVTTHVMDEAASCDVIIMLRDGRAIAQGSPASLIARTGTENLEQAFLALSGAQAADGRAADGVPADGVPADGAPADGVPADGVPASAQAASTKEGDDNA
jgi:ABC-2 type transport system ATP-binding protein